MTLPQQVNITLQACADFSKTYSLKNDDGSAKDLTNHTFTANIAKHTSAINAVTSTSTTEVNKYTALTTSIVNATGGTLSISLTETQTKSLDEGKYVYSIVMNDGSGNYSEVFRGLVFVTRAFGYVTSQSY